MFSNTNSIINVDTGQGKSLCAILPQLLFPNSVTVVISPLKRLMASQVKEYQYWGIRHVVTILGKHSGKLMIAGRIEPDQRFLAPHLRSTSKGPQNLPDPLTRDWYNPRKFISSRHKRVW
jgi:hypothetical protein